MKGKHLLAVLVVAILAFGLIASCSSTEPAPAPAPSPAPAPAPSPAPAPAPIELSINHEAPPSSVHHQGIFLPWTQMVEEATQGRLKFNIYHSGSISAAPDAYDSAVKGIADIAFGWCHFGPGDKPPVSVIQIAFAPFATTSQQGSYVMQKLYEEGYFLDSFSDTHLLCIFTLNPRVFHTIPPINTMADFSGLRLADGGPDSLAAIEALGGTGIAIPVGPERYTSLEKGAIDGILIAWEAMQGWNFWDFCKNHVSLPIDCGAFFITMNKDKYNSLPDDVKAVLDEYSGERFSQLAAEAWAARDNEVENIIRNDSAHTVVDLPQSEADKWRALGPQLWENWKARMAERNIDGQKILDRAIQLGEEYSKTH